MNREELTELFGEPISMYQDDQAVEDGLLVEVGQRDRVTRLVWSWLVERLPEGAQPPNYWPVEMMGWFGSKDPEVRALAAAAGLIASLAQEATARWEANGTYVVPVLYGRDGKIAELVTGRPATAGDFTGDHGARQLWLIPNELGGVTLMFPEDY